jgi:hypothetical protein
MGGASSCTVYFLYGTDINVLNEKTTPENMTDTGAFSAPLNSLTTNTTYYYKAIAENDVGTWTGFILKVIPGQPVVVTRQPGEIGNDHAILKGELWHTGGTAECNVWFIYSDQSPNQLDQSTAPQALNSTGPFQAYIGNLSTKTKYWYRAVADNGEAQGRGDIYEFTTPTAQIQTTGVLGKLYQPDMKNKDKSLLSKILNRYQPLFEKYPMLMKFLQQPRFKALLNKLHQ